MSRKRIALDNREDDPFSGVTNLLDATLMFR